MSEPCCADCSEDKLLARLHQLVRAAGEAASLGAPPGAVIELVTWGCRAYRELGGVERA